jgi:hypothetical protein
MSSNQIIVIHLRLGIVHTAVDVVSICVCIVFSNLRAAAQQIAHYCTASTSRSSHAYLEAPDARLEILGAGCHEQCVSVLFHTTTSVAAAAAAAAAAAVIGATTEY